MRNLKPRAQSIISIKNPEWGTWGIMADKGDWYEIYGDRGSRILFKSEAEESWKIVER
jgi:hypothetical protein